MPELSVRALTIDELPLLTKLFHYNDVQEMIAENTRSIEQGEADIFGLFEGAKLIGELHAIYRCDDEQKSIHDRRAYLCAFRIHKRYQGKGYGNYLLKSVIDIIAEKGYSEITVGVEDDNARAIHIYKQFGFNELIARKYEEYQGDGYEYNLYLKRLG